jgi:fermentation-respiration switch protein FrsA (DUF1100 family)
MITIESATIGFATAYGIAALGLALLQRRLLYFPDRRHTPLALAGLAGGEELRLETPDGETLVAWHFPPEAGKPVVLYLPGAAGALVDRAPRLRLFLQNGFGVMAVSYRGYGGSTGRPSEAGLLLDAECAYLAACARYEADRLIIVGASLGTGVAVALAAKHEAAALVLLAPFLSALDIAQRRLPFLPARWLMRDQFRSDLAISKVRAPVLMIHGARDPVIPIASSKRLFERANPPKSFICVPDGGHVVLGTKVFEEMRDWLEGVLPAKSAASSPRED